MEFKAALHGDVFGYSAMIADDEAATISTLHSHRHIIENAVEGFGGEMASFAGDEFLAVFRSAREAVDAAIQIQREHAIQNLLLPQGQQMRFRLGIHAGAIKRDDEGWYGDVVNIAARLQAEADPGGVTISAAAYDQAGDLNLPAEALGITRLKNIPEPVASYRLIDNQLPDAGSRLDRRHSPTHRPSLAVLPFLNLGDPEDGHFATGLMMSLLVELATIPGLDVISENTTLQLDTDGASEAAASLGSKYILEGAVQREGDQVRVMVRLLETATSRTIWADRFEPRVGGLFTAQDELVHQIAAAVDLHGIEELKAQSSMYRSHVDGASVELIYRAWQAFVEGTADGVRRAREFFDQVTERYPDSVVGWAEASWTYMWEIIKGWAPNPETNIVRAKELALKAQEKGDVTGLSRAVLAYVYLVERDWDNAYEAARKSTEERPSCDVTFGVAASVMRYLGRWQDAIDMGERAIRLSPLMNDWYRSTVANAYFVGGDYQSAAVEAGTVIADHEEETEALLTLAASEAALGRGRKAAATIHRVRQIDPLLSAEQLESNLPFKDEGTRKAFVDRLKEAGLD